MSSQPPPGTDPVGDPPFDASQPPQGPQTPPPWSGPPPVGQPGYAPPAGPVGYSAMAGGASDKTFLVTWLLALFLGFLAADRFYLGKIGTAIAKLLTLGGLGIWVLVDLIMTLAGAAKDKQGRPLAGYQENKRTAWIVTGLVVLLGLISRQVSPSEPAIPTASTSGTSAPAATQEASSRPTTAPSPAEATTPAIEATSTALPGIGTSVAAGDTEITVDGVSTTDQLTSVFGNKSGHWVVVDLTVKNNSSEQVTVNHSDFTLIEADGTEYSTDSDNLMYVDSDKNLFLQDINPKLSASGQILFATPAEASDFILKFDSGWFGPSAEIDLNS